MTGISVGHGQKNDLVTFCLQPDCESSAAQVHIVRVRPDEQKCFHCFSSFTFSCIRAQTACTE